MDALCFHTGHLQFHGAVVQQDGRARLYLLGKAAVGYRYACMVTGVAIGVEDERSPGREFRLAAFQFPGTDFDAPGIHHDGNLRAHSGCH